MGPLGEACITLHFSSDLCKETHYDSIVFTGHFSLADFPSFSIQTGTPPVSSVPDGTSMSCRDIHATNAFAFILAFVSVGGIAVAALIPQWRITRLVTFNRNAKNVSVYDGLWAKCVKQDGYSGCYYYDAEVLL